MTGHAEKVQNAPRFTDS